MDSSILTIITFLPIVGVLVMAFINRENHSAIKYTAWIVTFVDFLLSLYIYFNFDSTTDKFQFVYDVTWIKALGINYSVGIDGISLWLIILTTFLGWLAIWSSWTAIKDQIGRAHV